MGQYNSSYPPGGAGIQVHLSFQSHTSPTREHTTHLNTQSLEVALFKDIEQEKGDLYNAYFSIKSQTRDNKTILFKNINFEPDGSFNATHMYMIMSTGTLYLSYILR